MVNESRFDDCGPQRFGFEGNGNAGSSSLYSVAGLVCNQPWAIDMQLGRVCFLFVVVVSLFLGSLLVVDQLYVFLDKS